MIIIRGRHPELTEYRGSIIPNPDLHRLSHLYSQPSALTARPTCHSLPVSGKKSEKRPLLPFHLKSTDMRLDISKMSVTGDDDFKEWAGRLTARDRPFPALPVPLPPGGSLTLNPEPPEVQFHRPFDQFPLDCFLIQQYPHPFCGIARSIPTQVKRRAP